jgi:NAD-dependent dihydropyrimidine dehydrogenase PreA subunit
MAADDSYQILMDHLKYPVSKRLRALLEYLLTPGQARMAAALPGTPAEVAGKTGFDPDLVKKELEALFYAGCVFPKGDFNDRQSYRFARSVGQLHDASQAPQGIDVVKDRELYRLWHDFVMQEWYPDTGKFYAASPRAFARIVPAWRSIKDVPGVLPAEDIREILKAQSRIAVVPCSCRYRTTAVGEHCGHTAEENQWHCIQLNRGADYAMARGAGKELNIDEALALVDQVEAEGLLHTFQNNAALTGTTVACQCCTDCCMLAVPMAIVKAPLDRLWAKSRFIAVADEEACIGCQTCVDRCQFDAIEMVKAEGATKSKKLKARVDPGACFGCGVCVVGCDKTHALTMKLVRPPDHIPVKEA